MQWKTWKTKEKINQEILSQNKTYQIFRILNFASLLYLPHKSCEKTRTLQETQFPTTTRTPLHCRYRTSYSSLTMGHVIKIYYSGDERDVRALSGKYIFRLYYEALVLAVNKGWKDELWSGWSEGVHLEGGRGCEPKEELHIMHLKSWFSSCKVFLARERGHATWCSLTRHKIALHP